jgi:excisionase family DNA binding protein
VSDTILTIEEAAQLLKAPTDTVSELLESGDLPGRRVGGEWRTTTRALVTFVDGGMPSQMTCCVPVESGEGTDGSAICCQPATGRCC